MAGMAEITRRNLIQSGLAATASSLMFNSSVSAQATSAGIQTATSSERSPLVRRQNIVIFMPDEMRADSLGCYGNPVTKTPHFDKLAMEGARFANCHVQFPVCGASRCAMLTGWPTSVRGHRSLSYFLRPDEPNMFRYLRQAGYETFWFGKNDALAAQTFPDSVTRWADASKGQGEWFDKTAKSLTPGSASFLYSAGGDRTQTTDYKNVQSAIEVIKRKQADKPFCIFLPLTQPHPPYTIPKDFYDMYSPADISGLAPSGLSKKPLFHEAMRKAYGLDKLDELTFRKIRAVYYAQVSYSDWLLGELREALAVNGREGDTAVFVTSDHGDYTGDYGLIEKWTSGLEDCLTHVPMIAMVPGGKPGVVAEEMIEMYDIMPTVLGIAQTTANHTHFARTLLPQIEGMPGDPDRAAFAEGGYNVYEPQCFEPAMAGPYAGKTHLQHDQPETISRSAMIRTRTHKLIARPQGQSELYDCKADPLLTRNLFGESSAAALQVELQTKLLHHFINTTGVAPMERDQRALPEYIETDPGMTPEGWQKTLLDG